MLPSHRVPRQPGSQSRTTFYTASIATFRGVMQKRHHVDDFSHMKGYSPMETVCGARAFDAYDEDDQARTDAKDDFPRRDLPLGDLYGQRLRHAKHL